LLYCLILLLICILFYIVNIGVKTCIISVITDDAWPPAGIARQISVSSNEQLDIANKQSGIYLAVMSFCPCHFECFLRRTFSNMRPFCVKLMLLCHGIKSMYKPYFSHSNMSLYIVLIYLLLKFITIILLDIEWPWIYAIRQL